MLNEIAIGSSPQSSMLPKKGAGYHGDVGIEVTYRGHSYRGITGDVGIADANLQLQHGSVDADSDIQAKELPFSSFFTGVDGALLPRPARGGDSQLLFGGVPPSCFFFFSLAFFLALLCWGVRQMRTPRRIQRN